MQSKRGSFPTPELFDKPVVVYCTLGCSFCVMLRRALGRSNIDFVDVDITGDRKARAWLEQLTEETSVPQVFVHGKPVGGYSAVSALLDSGALKQMLAEAPSATALPPAQVSA